MSNYAIIENGLVTNVYAADAPLNKADILVTNQGIGWTYANGVFTAPPAPTPVPIPLPQKAQTALTKTDITMFRVQEAISLGLITATTADVVAFVYYRKALRAIVDGTDTTSTSLPAQPAYPANT